MTRRRGSASRQLFTLAAGVLALAASFVWIYPQFVGFDGPTSFSLCEEEMDGSGQMRPECQASDIRFEIAAASPGTIPDTDFGFALTTGFLNGDDLVDVVAGDPRNNRVYIFFGRSSVTSAYGLDSGDLADRLVSPGSQADVILERQPPFPGQVGSFGFSVAVGAERTSSTACPPGDSASALVIGAPGAPGTTGNDPGTVFHLPAGGLCFTPVDPPVPQVLDPEDIGSLLQSPDAADDDEFGYAVALGRLLTTTGTEEDLIVGARNALDGDGRVTIMPVSGGAVSTDPAEVVRIIGMSMSGDGLGEVLAVGDLDLDFDATAEPFGNRDDLAIGAVGHPNGKVLVVQGPLAPDGDFDVDGVYEEEVDGEVQTIIGESADDFFGFNLAIGADGRLAVGAVFADNDPSGNSRTNAPTGARINTGKAYVWDADVFVAVGSSPSAGGTADLVLVGRRSGDHLGFGLAFGDLDGSGDDDFTVTARREDGTGLSVDEIDQGAAYVIFDSSAPSSPIDLNRCAINSDCTGVEGIDVIIFGGDRSRGLGDEIGFDATAGDYNNDGLADLFLSSLTQKRVYAVTLADGDDDRDTEGRNIRDDDDDGDGDSDAVDCAPQDDTIFSGADEITCNGIDENCNGLADDAADDDGDGFDVCGDADTAADCDDNDSNSFPDATELCDGNDNACSGAVPLDERDTDLDGYVACNGWVDTQGDDPNVLAGGDCGPANEFAFPGAAENEADPFACMEDADDDGFGDETPAAGIDPGTDCDDGTVSAAVTFPGAANNEADPTACMKDADDDGFGDLTPNPNVTVGTDCNDADAATFPGAPELCDGNDNACAGSVPADEIDGDADTYVACSGWDDTQGDDAGIVAGDDCDDTDAETFPGAAAAEPFSTACMRDKDDDGYGDIAPPAGVTAGTDCDDTSAFASFTFPGAAEIEAPLNCMKDEDADGYGDAGTALPVVPGTDCADTDNAVFPGQTEITDDGIDQDCNGADTVQCFVDNDLDGFGDATPMLADDGDCADAGEAPTGDDCNDDDDAIFPGQPEVADDGIDQDCNGADTITCVFDADMDGFGNTAGTKTLADDGTCDADEQEAVSAGDCDETDPGTFPGAAELCDGNDNACAGSVPPDEIDVDGDLYVACIGWEDRQGDDPGIAGGDDCDETDTDTFAGAAPNEPVPTACMRDKDGDDYGDFSPPAGVLPGTDCDDVSPTAADTFPGAAPLDGPLNCMKDSDGDDRGDDSVTLPIVRGTDCVDDDAQTFPGAPDECDGNDNSCAGSLSPDEIDDDGDGYVECSGWSDPQGDDPTIAGGDDCNDTDIFSFPGAAANEVFPASCMRDEDGDDYGDTTPPAGVTPGTDCDDDPATGAATFPGAAPLDAPFNCMRDQDDDGYGDVAAALPVVAGTDCDDAVATTFPGAPEIPADSIDQDCDGSDLVSCFADTDGDGFGSTTAIPPGDGDCDDAGESSFDTDCNDANAAIFPGAPETPDDGLDQNCNGTDTITCQLDADRDGFGTTVGTTILANDGVCNASQQEAIAGGDCNDADSGVFPGAPESPDDGIDQDCNGFDTVTCFVDGDGDGFGGTSSLLANDGDCTDPGESGVDTDCDDGDATIFPGAAETPLDGIDQDCNGFDLQTCFIDGDGDGFGGTATIPPGDGDCDDPGESPFDTDCDDGDGIVFPGAPEISDDGVDQDCNGSDTISCTVDLDQDGFGTLLGTVTFADDGRCDAVQQESDTSDDCDDVNATVFPGAPEIVGDGIDQDCNGTDTVSCFVDGDGDGAGGAATLLSDDGDCADAGESSIDTDCNDADDTIFPGAAETADDGIDQDCNGTDTITCFVDGDQDGFGDAAGSTTLADDGSCDTADGESTSMDDCDDTEASAFPGGIEIPDDGIDQDCSGTDTITCVPDVDQDGFGTMTGATVPAADGQCDTAQSESATNDDCNDGDSAVFPGATEIPNDGIDQDCDGSDLLNCFVDGDGDGFGGTGILPPGDGDCDDPGESSFDTDCDDTNAAIFPGAGETADDGIDQDCNDADTITCIVDADRDGHGTIAGTPVLADDGVCDTSQDEADSSDDCDDSDPLVFPGAAEVPNDGIDQDCDGSDLLNCFVDDDGDGFGTSATILPGDGDCDDPGESSFDTDCDDTDENISPGATDTPDDGIDQNCDGNDTVTCFVDADQDGHGTNLGSTTLADDGSCDTEQSEATLGDDCNDGDPNSFPGAAELCDGNDNACLGTVPADETDLDGDGFAACAAWNDTQGDDPGITAGDDCDDISPDAAFIFPGAAPNEVFAVACMKDRDGDDWGDLDPPAGVVQGTDCDDDSPDAAFTFPGAAAIDGPQNCMRDRDGDDFGDSTATLPVVKGTDCDDTDGAISPAASEIPDDGIDQNCDGSDSVTCVVDADQDGFGTDAGTPVTAPDGSCDTADQEATSADDCDDSDDTVFPGAPETPLDGIDQDCDGSDLLTCFEDGDGDGFGSTVTIPPGDMDCTDPGESVFDTDCDDSNNLIFPGAPETVDDGVDQDCNGSDTITCTVDGDGDGFGTILGTPAPADDGSCDVAQGESATSDDCDDTSNAIFPGAAETPNDGIDQDCNGADTISCFVDADGDGFGGTGTLLSDDGDCSDPGESAVDTDCDDSNNAIFPGATEIPDDGIDQNCDGSDSLTCFVDGDGDGFGGTSTALSDDGDCTDPGESAVDTDCNDGNNAIFPGAAETADDGIDQDCNGADTVTCFVDGDGDSFGGTSTLLAGDGDCTDAGESDVDTDCDDTDDTIFPGAPEIPFDGIDQDCMGGDLMNCFEDGDGDGFGSTNTVSSADSDCNDPGESDLDTDCDDGNNAIFPGATETTDDGIDQDCSGADTITCIVDADMDGFGTDLGTITLAADGSCDAADSESATSDDCNDGDNTIFPGATDAPDDGIDQDCNGSDTITCFVDGDGDGFGGTSTLLAADGDCTDPGESAFDTDCNDAELAIFPGAPETCGDGIDSNCDGSDPVCPITSPDILLSAVDASTQTWSQTPPDATEFCVYRGDLEVLRSTGDYTQSPDSAPGADRFCGVVQQALADAYNPALGEVVYYLITARTPVGETDLGDDSLGSPRPNTNPCP